LESLIANGKPLPLTKNAIVDREQALNLIDELRAAVPEEVRAAKRINQEGERIIEKAQEEAERIIARAQEQAAFLIGERGLTEAAEEESRRIIADAEDDGDNVRRGADEYAAGVLAALEAEVNRTLRGIERGIAMLDERRASYAVQPEPEPAPEPAYADDAAAGNQYVDDEGLGDLARR
jgi:cell division septum initiation protein DivIVA